MARRRRKSSISTEDCKSTLLVCGKKRQQLTKKQSATIENRDLSCFYINKKPESWILITLQLLMVSSTLILCLYTYFWFDHFHYHLTHFYAENMDDHHAQHLLGHKLIRNGSHNEAFQWFRRSANNGHAHSAYNLAVGHLNGYKTDVKQGEVRQLLHFAAKNGVQEAKQLLAGLCRDKPNYCDL